MAAEQPQIRGVCLHVSQTSDRRQREDYAEESQPTRVLLAASLQFSLDLVREFAICASNEICDGAESVFLGVGFGAYKAMSAGTFAQAFSPDVDSGEVGMVALCDADCHKVDQLNIHELRSGMAQPIERAKSALTLRCRHRCGEEASAAYQTGCFQQESLSHQPVGLSSVSTTTSLWPPRRRQGSRSRVNLLSQTIRRSPPSVTRRSS